MDLEQRDPIIPKYELPKDESSVYTEYKLIHMNKNDHPDHYFDVLLKVDSGHDKSLLIMYKEELCRTFGYFKSRFAEDSNWKIEKISDGREIIEFDLVAIEKDMKIAISTDVFVDFFKSIYHSKFELLNTKNCGVYYFLSQYLNDLDTKKVDRIRNYCKRRIQKPWVIPILGIPNTLNTLQYPEKDFQYCNETFKNVQKRRFSTL